MFKTMMAGVSLLAGLFSPCVMADDGHGHDAPAATAAAPALPRFSADSELFEIVGIADGQRLTLYVDRFADNAPVAGAALEVSVAEATVAMKEVAGGEFEGTLAHALQPGVTPVTITVQAGQDTDLLAGEFDVHAAHAAEGHAPAWRALLPWAALGVVAAGAAVVLLRRGRLRRGRAARAGGAA